MAMEHFGLRACSCRSIPNFSHLPDGSDTFRVTCKVPLPECVGEKAVKFGIRNRETRLREVPVSGAEGHLSRLFTRRQESRFCDLLAEKYSQGNAEAA